MYLVASFRLYKNIYAYKADTQHEMKGYYLLIMILNVDPSILEEKLLAKDKSSKQRQAGDR